MTLKDNGKRNNNIIDAATASLKTAPVAPKKRAKIRAHHTRDERLKLAAETLSLTLARAAKRLKVSIPSVSAWRAEYRVECRVARARGTIVARAAKPEHDRQVDNLLREERGAVKSPLLAKDGKTDLAKALDQMIAVLKAEARAQIVAELGKP